MPNPESASGEDSSIVWCRNRKPTKYNNDNLHMLQNIT
jgi:hypothetical protein